ncbi:hypothetical protein S40285_08518 [Stachybotrys chlorohalonatus IBT 40285]|uniref:Uncharacterized protein n=1 Tax=Stachybotrys chlorohalonatus (strain IBT 40285) TaxID=1283841 RepID=A0A084QZD3_STAC4|nr:hypothetical protein S40285_08518 [Stachybotrys chlorohalonata IBT 40285]
MLGSRFFVIVTYTTQSHALEWPAQYSTVACIQIIPNNTLGLGPRA